MGVLLRRYRRAAGLTQEALAERAGVSVRGLSDLERGVNRAPRAATLRLLAEGLELAPEARASLAAAARRAGAALGGAAAPGHNLPASLTSFVGRERELAEIRRLLPTTRLLTLTGAGGCGKTRLALRVAAALADSYPHGVRLVELADMADLALLAPTAAAAFGVPETPGRPAVDGLAAWLGPKSVLLVLDNCEHVVAAAAELVETLLRRCPGLRVLATSREALGCAGETVWRVSSLALPPPGVRLPLGRLWRYEAVRLFVERARAARPGLAADERSAPVVADICRRLDGIPLAIELAAARVRVFSVEQIAARLDDRFRLLTAGPRTALPRQRTLRATVDWSHALLAGPERALLRRLAVFAGGWTFEAAEAVGAGAGIRRDAVLDLLAGLVEKSLVLAEEQHGAVRYRLLETIREYARDRLRESGEEAQARDRHLAYFLRLAEEAEPELRGAGVRGVLERLDAEHDNLRAALEWGLAPARQDAAALRLSGALSWYWWLRTYHDEGWRWLTRALAAPPGRSAARLAARMKALHGAGWLAHHRRDAATARALLGESLALARRLRDRWTVAWALHALGRVAYFGGDPATARSLGEESLALAEELGDGWLTAHALHLLGLAAHIANDYQTARAYYARSLALRRQIGHQDGIAVLLTLLSIAALREGDLGAARVLIREALLGAARASWVLGPWGLANGLAIFCRIAAAQGQAIRAARLGAAVAALGAAHHTPLVPLYESLLEEGLDLARQALGPAVFAAALGEGRALSPEDAVAEALAVETSPPAPRGRRRAAGLSAAETRVLRLLVGDRTT